MALFTANKHTWDFASSIDYTEFSTSLLPYINAYTLPAANNLGLGITHDDNYIYIFDNTDDLLYKYDYDFVQIDTINLHANNDNATGLTSDGTYFYAVDNDDNLVYKYTSDWVFVSTHALHADNANAWGITWDENYFYITDITDRKVYKYSPTWSLQTSYLLPAANAQCVGLAWDGEYFYVTDSTDDKLYKYDSSWSLQTSYDLHADNDTAWGITWDGDHFYITDPTLDKVFKYRSADIVSKTVAGHNDTIVLYDEMVETFDSAQMADDIEFWLRAINAADKIEVILKDTTGNACINVSINNDKIIGDGSDALDPASDYTWYRIRVAFDCTPNTYDLYVDGDLELNNQAFGVNDDGSGIKSIAISVNTNENGFIQGIGYGWDPAYTVGDNADDIVDITDNITYCKIIEEMNADSFANLRVKGSLVSDLEAGHEIEFLDKDDISSWTGIILYPESVLEGTDIVGKLKLIGLDSRFNYTYRKNFTTVRDSDYIIKNMIDNGLIKYHSYNDEIDNFLITYKYDLKNKIRKMMFYLSMLERAVIHYKPNGEIFFNKYDNLSKGSQIYQATYSFEDQDVGDQGTAITWIDSCETEIATEIIYEFDGHKKVLRVWEAAGSNDWNIHDFPSASLTGFYSFWIATTDITRRGYMTLRESGLSNINFGIQTSKFQIYTGGAWRDVAGAPAPVNNTLYHIYIQWYADSTFDLEINEIQYENGTAFNNAFVGAGIDDCYFSVNDGLVYYYFDSPISSLDGDTKGDNLKCWNENTKKIKITSYTPAANRHVTRAPVIGANNDLGQVYKVGRAIEEEEDQFGINELQPWRDPEITNYTEANQIATNLQTIYSIDTQMIEMLTVKKGHLQVGKTLNLGMTGLFSITQHDFLLTKRIWHPINDISEIELTDNILTRKAFNVRVINKFYDEDAQQSYDEPDASESTVAGTVQVLRSLANLRANAPIVHIVAGAPDVNYDVDDGVEIGDLYIDTTNTKAYICLSNTSGAADWNQID